MKQTFKTKEEAIDYVLLVAKLHGGPKLSIKCSKRPELRKIINMAFYLGCLNELIKDENNYYENILKTIRQYSHFKDFKKYYNSHFDIASLIDGMLDAFFFYEYDSLKHTNGFWKIYYNRYIAAKTCTTTNEYRKRFSTAYLYSKENNELENFTWLDYFEYNDDNIKNSLVYVYIDNNVNENNKPIAYVGRTLDYLINKRNREHLNGKDDTVYRYFKSLGRNVPEMIILKMNLTLSESRYFEDYYLHFYKNRGYHMINTAVTGITSSSIGGGSRLWNYENTYKEAQKYKYIKDFQKKSCGAYTAALHKNWLDDYYWLIRRMSRKRNYEECYSAARKYDKMSDFIKNDRKIYDSAKYYGWLDDYYWLKRTEVQSWPKERCFEESKKYDTILELKRNNYSLLSKLYLTGWIKEMPWLKKTRITLTNYEALLKASFYNNLVDLRRNENKLYQSLKRRNLLIVLYDENNILKPNIKDIIESYNDK